MQTNHTTKEEAGVPIIPANYFAIHYFIFEIVNNTKEEAGALHHPCLLITILTYYFENEIVKLKRQGHFSILPPT